MSGSVDIVVLGAGGMDWAPIPPALALTLAGLLPDGRPRFWGTPIAHLQKNPARFTSTYFSQYTIPPVRAWYPSNAGMHGAAGILGPE
jgi:hypothetical protein